VEKDGKTDAIPNMAKRRTDNGQAPNGSGQTPWYQRLLGWLLLSAFMFTVGVFVGRGTAPVQFDVPDIQARLQSLRHKAYDAAVKYYKIENGASEDKTSLKYREALRKPADPDVIRDAPVKTSRKAATQSKPSAAPAPEKKSDTPNGAYVLQIASMKDGAAAEELARELRQRGYAAYSEPIEIAEKGTWYRVRLGDYPSPQAVEKVQGELGAIGRDAMVIRK
jgi:cell division septation protein DedD